jgi:FkbM family methyltransferase
MKKFFDGLDWIFSDGKSALVYHEETIDPFELIGINIPLFTLAYTPKLGDVVFDVGAGIGTEIATFSELVGENGRVIAIEADPVCFRRLEKLVQILELKNVTCLNIAVSDESGQAWITQDREDGLGNHLSDEYLPGSKKIDKVRFSELMLKMDIERINYMKINIEGAEISALSGLGLSVSRIENLCISCHNFLPDPDMHTFDDVLKYLIKRGFQVRKHEDNPRNIWESWYLYGSRSNEITFKTDFLSVAERDSAVAERDSAVAERDSAVAERDSAVAERDSAVAERDSAVAELQTVLESTTWRAMRWYRKLKS